MGPAPLSRTCCPAPDPRRRPTLWLAPGHAVYVGPSLDLDVHSGSVACLAVGLDAGFTVALAGVPGRRGRTALIPPRTPHKLVAEAGWMAFCYLDPGSARDRAGQAHMTERAGGIGFRHRHEDELVRQAPALSQPGGPGPVRSWLDLATTAQPGLLDPRIRAATARLHRPGGAELSASQLAAEVGLSTSRFLHLFRDHAGTTLRRYRLWVRMLAVAGSLAERATDLTTAAADAGFASPSHFSRAFHTMFGLTPSRLLGAEVTIVDVSPGRTPPHR